MNDDASTTWQVVRELGLEYHAVDRRPGNIALSAPATIEVTADGARLIVDELATEKGVPVRHECRTLLVDAGNRILLDTLAEGTPDGYGCLIDDGTIAVMHRTRWEIAVRRRDGAMIGRLNLARISKLPPRIIAWTGRSFLVVFLSAAHVLDIVEVDRRGRPLWYLPEACKKRLGVPGSVQLLGDGALLAADEFRHVVHHVSRDGTCRARYGYWADPGPDLKRLSAPKFARELPDGTLLVADTHNHRFLSVDPHTGAREIALPDRCLVAPTFIAKTAEGYLACDAGNRVVLAFDESGRETWSVGSPLVKRRHFSFPRSVQRLGEDRYLVADTAGNRVVECSPAGTQVRPFQGAAPLFWPRAAQQTSQGTTLIADGRRSRVIELDKEGRVLVELSKAHRGAESLPFDDPHDVREMPGDGFLIVDAAEDLVCEIDRQGEVRWAIGPDEPLRLRDPHSAQPLADGRILIADSGNHRVLFYDPRDGSWQALSELRNRDGIARLNFPRYAEMAPDGTLVIADTGNHRLLAGTPAGELIWELATIPDSPIETLLHPRWACALGRDEVIVSDHFHHRIVHLRRTADGGAHEA